VIALMVWWIFAEIVPCSPLLQGLQMHLLACVTSSHITPRDGCLPGRRYSSSDAGKKWYTSRPSIRTSIQGTMYRKADATLTRALGGALLPLSSAAPASPALVWMSICAATGS
jgi:hypothetical protein